LSVQHSNTVLLRYLVVIILAVYRNIKKTEILCVDVLGATSEMYVCVPCAKERSTSLVVGGRRMHKKYLYMPLHTRLQNLFLKKNFRTVITRN